jgi:hypothetical protein
MRIMIPPPGPEDFRVGSVVTGVVKNIVEFGAFIEFLYTSGGRQWGIDGLLHFWRTPRSEEARAWKVEDRVTVVVTKWDRAKTKLAVALPADPIWLTSDVVALARGIVAENAFDRMPILADALQDAGCTDETVLNHCRSPKAGNWLIPLLIGASV